MLKTNTDNMNIKERLIELNHEYSKKMDKKFNEDIDELLLTIISKFQLFEPCRYLSEDEEWLNVAMISLGDEDMSQPLSIKKSEITTFGVFNPDELEVEFSPQKESQDLYQ